MGLLVSKTALGRGLGKLLGGRVHGSPKADSAMSTPGMSPGVARLFEGGKSEAGTDGAKGEAQGGERGEVTNNKEEQVGKGRKVKQVIRWSLVAGDVSILGLVAWVLLESGKPLTSLEILIGVLAVVTGAWLASLALYLD
jgi:hypothetical protein